jgi:sporulation protein YunB
MKMVASPHRKMRLSRKFLRWTVIVVLLLTAAFLVLQNNISQVILDRAYANAYSLAVKVINSAVADVMRTGVTYEDLITIHMSDQGQVTMLQANTIRMNELATSVALQAQEKLQDASNQIIQIPLGAALGINFLAGSGPNISVKILPVGAVSTQFITEFESAGINQSRHKILLSAKTTVRMVIPTGSKQVEMVSSIPIAESIIVGAVPDTFVDVNDKSDILNLIP